MFDLEALTKPCTRCGYEMPHAVFQCTSCKAWNLDTSPLRDEHADATPDECSAGLVMVPLSEVSDSDECRTVTGPWDACFGGGIVSHSVTFLAGEPGAGKSTMGLQIADVLARSAFERVYYFYVEGSKSAVKDYGSRLGLSNMARILTPDALNAAGLLAFLDEDDRSFPLIVDSASAVTKHPGLSAEICTRASARSVRVGAPTILLGHINKDGELAGTKELEHLVDALLFLRKTKVNKAVTDKRVLSSLKNRFGADASVTLRMTERGLVEYLEGE